MRCLAIIPAFNEASAVGDVIRAIQRERPDVDVTVIDDGSRDATALVAREAGAIVVGVATIVERGAAPLLAENNLEYKYAYSLTDLGL